MDSAGSAEGQGGPARFDAVGTGRPTHQSLKQMAADYIREGVVSGRLGPGAKVDQDEIAETLGISRLPIREALIELTAKGFVESIPRRGAFVAKLTTQDIEDHYEIVGLFFGLAAQRAIERIDADKIAALQILHTEITDTQDPVRRRALLMEFYRIINRVGISDRLLLTMQFLALALPNDFYFSTSRWPATETVYRERILTALENRDAQDAVKATHEHFQACAKITIGALRTRGYWSESENMTEAAS